MRRWFSLGALLALGCGDPTVAGAPDRSAPLPPAGGELAPSPPDEALAPAEGPIVARPDGPPFVFEQVRELPAPAGGYNVAPAFTLFDLEGDGDLDLLWPRGTDGTEMLRNDGGMSFTPVDAGIPEFPATSAAVADCDGDGDLDLLLLGDRTSVLLRREGARFTTDARGPVVEFGPAGPTFFDADGDGDPDLVIPTYSGDEIDHFYLNEGDCGFTDATERIEQRPRDMPPAGTHGASPLDVDDDGDTDLIVFDDFGFLAGPDRLLINDGTGHFTEDGASWGLGQAIFSMGAEVADIDGDGNLDVYKANICRNPLLLGQGPGKPFVDDRDDALGLAASWIDDPGAPPVDSLVSDPNDPTFPFMQVYGLGRPDVPTTRCLTSWASPAADLDADGRRELLVVNGRVGVFLEAKLEPALLFWRPEGETRFQEIGAATGLRHQGLGRTGAVADLDGDGRLDVVIGNLPPERPDDDLGHVFRNLTPRDRLGHALWLQLRGPGANTQGLGAIVRVTASGTTQIAYRTLGTSFAATTAAPLHFGIGEAMQAEVEVSWPWGGGVDRFTVAADAPVTLGHGEGR